MTFIPSVGNSYMPSVGDFCCKIRILSVILNTIFYEKSFVILCKGLH